MRLVLASASPRRARLLDQLGFRYEVVPADIDETRMPDEGPAAYVERMARAKAASVPGSGDEVVIAADTAVVFEGHVLGKPSHPEQARSMLRRLRAKRHEVFTAVTVRRSTSVESLVDVTHVQMLPMTEEEISEYVASGEPMDKAGSYALQGFGGVFVESVSGSPFTVIGLPIHLLPRLLRSVGADMELELDGFRLYSE